MPNEPRQQKKKIEAAGKSEKEAIRLIDTQSPQQKRKKTRGKKS